MRRCRRCQRVMRVQRAMTTLRCARDELAPIVAAARERGTRKPLVPNCEFSCGSCDDERVHYGGYPIARCRSKYAPWTVHVNTGGAPALACSCPNVVIRVGWKWVSSYVQGKTAPSHGQRGGHRGAARGRSSRVVRGNRQRMAFTDERDARMLHSYRGVRHRRAKRMRGDPSSCASAHARVGKRVFFVLIHLAGTAAAILPD